MVEPIPAPSAILKADTATIVFRAEKDGSLPAHQHRDIGALAAAIRVKLVEHQVIEPMGVCDDRAVERALARHQQLEHHELSSLSRHGGTHSPLMTPMGPMPPYPPLVVTPGGHPPAEIAGNNCEP
jgi:hypothetical protein